MNKKHTVLLTIVLCIMVIISAGYGYMDYVGTRLDKESKAFVDNAMPKILANWDITEFTRYCDQKTMEKVGFTKDKAIKLFEWNSEVLGKMLEYQGSKGDAVLAVEKTDFAAHYIAKAKFERGKANVSILLSKNGGEWKISELHVAFPPQQKCEQMMTASAKKNTVDPAQYISQNQEDLKKCIQQYNQQIQTMTHNGDH